MCYFQEYSSGRKSLIFCFAKILLGQLSRSGTVLESACPHSKKKKCEISHFWSGPPLPLKSVKLENFFFTHQLKHVLVKSLFKKIYFFTQNPRRLKEISRFSPNLVQNCDFQVRGYSPPHILKKFFFADLHALGHERKKKKKSVTMTQFCPDPECTDSNCTNSK